MQSCDNTYGHGVAVEQYDAADGVAVADDAGYKRYYFE